MIVPDVNVILYATFRESPDHERAQAWWTGLLSGSATVGLSMLTIFGFIRLSTNLRIMQSALPVEDAVSRVESWLSRPQVEMVHPGPRHLQIAFDLLREAGTGANLTTDAQLAALAIEHQAELHSADTDFARFPGLRWVNPLKRR